MNMTTALTAVRRWMRRMDRNKVVEKFTNVLNGCIRVVDVKELVDALMECAREEALAELNRRVYVAMKERGLLKEVQE